MKPGEARITFCADCIACSNWSAEPGRMVITACSRTIRRTLAGLVRELPQVPNIP